jgi:hypothetical protein
MPNIPQQQTIVQYVANASQLTYTFAFYAPEVADIQVFYQSPTTPPNPESQELILNVDYSVTFNPDPTTGGTITLLFTPVTGNYLTINLFILASLDVNFGLAQNFNGTNLDNALNRLLMICQQNQNYILYRNLSYLINTYLPNAIPFTQLPPLALNQVWIGGASGVVAATIASNPSASVLQSLLANAANGADGALIVGYYDSLNSNPTTVHAALASLQTNVANVFPILANNLVGTDGASLIGYYDTNTNTSYTLDSFLNNVYGKILSSIVLNANAVSLTTATFANITMITVPAGKWIIWGNAWFNVSAAASNIEAAISTTSASFPDLSQAMRLASTSATLGASGFSVPMITSNSNTPTTFYLVGLATFGSGTVTASGAIYALQLR